MTRTQANHLLDRVRDGALLSTRVVRKALRASGDLGRRREWQREQQAAPARERAAQHPGSAR